MSVHTVEARIATIVGRFGMRAPETTAAPRQPADRAFVDHLDAAVHARSIASPSPVAGSRTPVLTDSIREVFASAAEEAGVDVDLLLAVAWTESGFDQSAVSHAGAIGMMQLMPSTAADLGVDPFDLIENVRGGARYLAEQLAAFGSVEHALAAYNAGPGRVRAAGGIPAIAETQAYVPRVLARLEQLRNGDGLPAPLPASPQTAIAPPVPSTPAVVAAPVVPSGPPVDVPSAAEPTSPVAAPAPPDGASPAPTPVPVPEASSRMGSPSGVTTAPVETTETDQSESDAVEPLDTASASIDEGGRSLSSEAGDPELSMPRAPSAPIERVEDPAVRGDAPLPGVVADEGLEHGGVPQIGAAPVRSSPVPTVEPPMSLPQLSNLIARRAGGGEQTIIVHLDPPELGRVTLRLVTRGDEVLVSLLPTNPDAVPSLSELRGDVDQMLRDQGLELGGFDVGAEGDDSAEESETAQPTGSVLGPEQAADTDGALRV